MLCVNEEKVVENENTVYSDKIAPLRLTPFLQERFSMNNKITFDQIKECLSGLSVREIEDEINVLKKYGIIVEYRYNEFSKGMNWDKFFPAVEEISIESG